MKSTTQKNTAPAKKGSDSNSTKRAATNPGKPGNDPDQTPNKEVGNVPTAKSTKGDNSKTKIGFKK